MPLYQLTCPDPECDRMYGRTQGKILRRGELDTWLAENPCVCGGSLVRAPTGPGCTMFERLDNGSMPKAVERPVAIKEMVREHNKKAEE